MRSPARHSARAGAVTQAEIVRALEDGTAAELRLRDWDLQGAADRRPVRIAAAAALAGVDCAPSGRVWAGLLAAVAAGVPTGIRLTGALRLAASA